MVNGGGPARLHPNLAPRWLRRLWAAHPLVVASGVVVLALAVTLSLLWPLTDVVAAHDVGLITGPQRAAALQAAREAVRTELLTLGAGVFVAGALIFTARNFTLSRRSVELQRQTFELTAQGQVTDRYTRAIEQLGSDKLDVRIGGIYALERVARDSTRDHPTVMEVIAAFVREHSREQWPLAKGAAGTTERATRPDVQAALAVIGRRDTGGDRGQINLVGSNLTGAYLRRTNFEGATFFRAELTGITLVEANVARAVFYGADLTRALLIRADLTKANLGQANLSRADLTGAKLVSAALGKAELATAKLVGADLTGANLQGAKIRGANLSLANLSGANLTNADLPDSDLAGANFSGADLTGAWVPVDAVPPGWHCPPGSGRLARVTVEPSPDVDPTE